MDLVFYNPWTNKIEFGEGEAEPWFEIMLAKSGGLVFLGSL